MGGPVKGRFRNVSTESHLSSSGCVWNCNIFLLSVAFYTLAALDLLLVIGPLPVKLSDWERIMCLYQNKTYKYTKFPLNSTTRSFSVLSLTLSHRSLSLSLHLLPTPIFSPSIAVPNAYAGIRPTDALAWSPTQPPAPSHSRPLLPPPPCRTPSQAPDQPTPLALSPSPPTSPSRSLLLLSPPSCRPPSQAPDQPVRSSPLRSVSLSLPLTVPSLST